MSELIRAATCLIGPCVKKKPSTKILSASRALLSKESYIVYTLKISPADILADLYTQNIILHSRCHVHYVQTARRRLMMTKSKKHWNAFFLFVSFFFLSLPLIFSLSLYLSPSPSFSLSLSFS